MIVRYVVVCPCAKSDASAGFPPCVIKRYHAYPHRPIINHESIISIIGHLRSIWVLVSLAGCCMSHCPAGSHDNAASGHISQIRSIASICTAVIAICNPHSRFQANPNNTAKSSARLVVMQLKTVLVIFW